jgi:hypothetical protein
MPRSNSRVGTTHSRGRTQGVRRRSRKGDYRLTGVAGRGSHSEPAGGRLGESSGAGFEVCVEGPRSLQRAGTRTPVRPLPRGRLRTKSENTICDQRSQLGDIPSSAVPSSRNPDSQGAMSTRFRGSGVRAASSRSRRTGGALPGPAARRAGRPGRRALARAWREPAS